MYLAVGRSPTIASSSTLVLRPSGDLPELIPEVVLPIGGGQHLTVRGYVDVIRKAKQDRRVARLLIKPGGLESPFWAKSRRSVTRSSTFGGAASRCTPFLDTVAARSSTWPRPPTRCSCSDLTLDLTGLPSYEVFLRGTFDWVGTYPDFLHVGDYKTAVNTFTEKALRPRTAR